MKGGTAFLVTALIAAGYVTESRPDFETLYDYYFLKQGEYMNSEYRKAFDTMLFGPPLSTEYRLVDQQLYYAFRGDSAGFHAFVHNKEREGDGHFGEEWVYKCVLIVLRLGDDRCSELLAREDRETREAFGTAIEQQIDWDEHQFPKTRALYSFRYTPQPLEEVRERHRGSTVTAMLTLQRAEVRRLRAAIAKDNRFSGVTLLTRGSRAMIMVPKEQRAGDQKDLVRIVEKIVPSQRSIRFE